MKKFNKKEKKENEKREQKKHEAIQKLAKKFGNKIVAEKIYKKKIWLDMSEDMLIVSQGKPDKIEKSVTKTKTRKKYYYSEFINREKNKSYKKAVILENGIVTGWKDL